MFERPVKSELMSNHNAYDIIPNKYIHNTTGHHSIIYAPQRQPTYKYFNIHTHERKKRHSEFLFII